MPEDFPEDYWEEIPQGEWEDIVLRVDDEGEWHVRFSFTDEYGNEHDYPEESISWDEFLDIYDEAAALDQELEIEY
jgi:hypothetical protein